MKNNNIEKVECKSCWKTLYIDKTKDPQYEWIHSCYDKNLHPNIEQVQEVLDNLTKEDLASIKES